MNIDVSSEVTIWLLVFGRIGAIMMLLPALGDRSIPSRIKLVMALLLAMALAPVVGAKYPSPEGGELQLGSMIVSEVLVGLIFGTLIRTMFSAIMVAGTVISTQTGIAMATVFDPTMGASNPVLGRLLSAAAVVLIFQTNVHHLFIAGMVRSYAMFPPGHGLPFADIAELAVRVVAQSFALGIQLAAPFLLYGLIFNVALGFVSRLTPTIQVFFVAQPLNMLFTFALLMMFSGVLLSLFVTAFAENVKELIG